MPIIHLSLISLKPKPPTFCGHNNSFLCGVYNHSKHEILIILAIRSHRYVFEFSDLVVVINFRLVDSTVVQSYYTTFDMAITLFKWVLKVPPCGMQCRWGRAT